MRTKDVRVGAFYSDGKLGLREVIAEGPHLRTASGACGHDPIRYRILHAQAEEKCFVSEETRTSREHNCERSSMAAWAKTEVSAENVAETLAALQAKAFRASPAQAALVLRLAMAQNGTNLVQPVAKTEMGSARALAAAGFLIMPAGTAFARLSPSGYALQKRLETSPPVRRLRP